jgi:heat shock protein HslJ
MHLTTRVRTAALVLLLPVVARAASGRMTSPDVNTGAWTLVGVDRRAPAAEGALSLLPDGTFTVRPGCNTGGGSYVIDGNRLVTDGIGLTMMACDEAVMAQEKVFVQVLDSDPRYEVETGTGRLLLTGGDSTLAFEAQ